MHYAGAGIYATTKLLNENERKMLTAGLTRHARRL